MAQSGMKKQSSTRTVLAVVAGLLAGILAFAGWHCFLLTAILVALAVFALVWWLLGLMWADDAADASVATPTAEPTSPPEPAMSMAEAAAPAASVMQAAAVEPAPVAAKKPRAAAKPKTAAVAAAPAAKAKAAPKPKAPKVEKPDGPLRLSAPRKGKADDLKEIEGIGPALEKLCNSLGFYHFDQIAGWSDADVAWVDANMKTFKGRIVRDKWIAQSKIILTEGLEAFRLRAKTNDY